MSFIIIIIISVISVHAEEELTLDDEIPSKPAKQKKTTSPASKKQSDDLNFSQNETQKIEDKKIKISQPETKTNFTIAMEDLFQKKQYNKMTKILWSKIDLLSLNELSLLMKGHFFNEEYSDSIKVANLILAKDEKNEEALTNIGNCKLKLKKDREAKEYFTKATEANPIYSPAINGLVEIYEKNHNYYELRLIYLDLIHKLGERPEYLKKLCDINTKDAVNDSAIEFCNKSISSNPKQPESFVNLGLVYKNLKDSIKAKEQLKRAADKFPNSDEAQFQYALLSEEQKNFVEAYKYYKQCIQSNLKHEKCFVGLGSSSYQLLKFEDSYNALKKACSFNRKTSFVVRRAATQARNAKQNEWSKKLDHLADICGN
ncbi:MAG: tetratricopeptide repeat protein [Bdellovibrionaceae bacterium]|nr:tetratricopeptide repeat protein [Pseudobdellovibrionaceae bacterium]